MLVRSRAPLRLGLAGGGSDVDEYSRRFGGAVLNATINKFAYATIVDTETDNITFHATCQAESWQGEKLPFLEFDGKLDLYKAVYNRVVDQFNKGQPLAIRLSTFSDAPPGSGLGSSSTLVVAMLAAMLEYLNVSLSDYEIAQMAYDIERVDVGLHGGKQDQYAATFGGFNFIEFHADGQVLVNPLRIKKWVISELESSLLLYFTGVSRSSASIIDQQIKNISTDSGDDPALMAMHQVKQQAFAMKEHLLKGNIAGIAETLNAGWQFKKQTSTDISNSLIEDIFERAMNAGAVGGKVSGAGGGGFIMFVVDPEKRSEVETTLKNSGGTILNCSFTQNGFESWRLK